MSNRLALVPIALTLTLAAAPGCAVGLQKHPLSATQSKQLVSRPTPAAIQPVDGLSTVRVSVPIDAPPEQVWQRLAIRYGDVHQWSGPIADSGLEHGESGAHGAVRSCTLGPNAPLGKNKSFSETILVWDPDRHYFLAGVDDGFYPMKQVVQEFWVQGDGGASVVTTQFHFNLSFPMGPAEKKMVGRLKQPMVRSLTGLKHLVETGNAAQAQDGDYLAKRYPDVFEQNGV